MKEQIFLKKKIVMLSAVYMAMIAFGLFLTKVFFDYLYGVEFEELFMLKMVYEAIEDDIRKTVGLFMVIVNLIFG